MSKEIYLDHNATTPVAPEVQGKVLRYLSEEFGNPSSLHPKGVEAERAVKESRRVLAGFLGVHEYEIVFTSGATESDNFAIKGIVAMHARRGKHVVTTEIEHNAVRAPLKGLGEAGFEITRLAPGRSGEVSARAVCDAVRPDTILVSVMHVNNELGTIYPIEDIARAVKEKNPETAVFSDGAQAFGKIPVRLENIDLYALSGHKIHGPKGIGALYIKSGTNIAPQIIGGGQERGMRGGTENVPGIVGLAEAARLACEDMKKNREHVGGLRTRFLKGVEDIGDVHLNSPEKGIETTANIAFLGIPAEVLLHALEEEGIFVSSGSACSARSRSQSHVLAALPIPDDAKRSSLRFGFSRYNTAEEVDYAVNILKKVIPELRGVTLK